MEWRADGRIKTSWKTMKPSGKEMKYIINGKLKGIWRLDPSLEVVEVIKYDENGLLKSKGYHNMRGNPADGEYHYFDESGVLTNITFWKNGVRVAG